MLFDQRVNSDFTALVISVCDSLRNSRIMGLSGRVDFLNVSLILGLLQQPDLFKVLPSLLLS